MDTKIMRKRIDEVIEKMQADQPEADVEMHRKLLIDTLEKGMLPKESMGFDDAFVETVYAYAYQDYRGGKYERARMGFAILNLLDPLDQRFIMGIAATHHMEKNYEYAIKFYIHAAALNIFTPYPLWHMVDCWLKLEEPYCAIGALEDLLLRVKHEPAFKSLKNKAEVQLEALRAEHGEKPSEPKRRKKRREKKAVLGE